MMMMMRPFRRIDKIPVEICQRQDFLCIEGDQNYFLSIFSVRSSSQYLQNPSYNSGNEAYGETNATSL
jgi:hypothetical protein